MSTDHRRGVIDKNSYRPDIDGLRAIAVVAVVINHLDKRILPSGHLGVDIFFVISGFVITASLIGHGAADFQSFITGFYARRFKRLLPALIVFVLVSSLLICLVNPDPGLSLRTGMAALFGFSNLYLLSQESNYFSPDSDMNIFTHTWSLGLEEQFYFVFPLLVWLTGLKKAAPRRALVFGLILMIFMLGSWLVYRNLSFINPSAAFFLMPTRFWELGAGSICFLLFSYCPKDLIKRLGYPLPIFLVIFACLAFQAQPWLSPYRLTSIVVLLVVVFLLSLNTESLAYKILSSSWLVSVGRMSYSIYLWHWSFICLARWTVGINALSVPVILVLTLAFSTFSYRWIENKFRFQPRQRSPLTVLGIGVLSSSAAAAFGLLLTSWGYSKLFASANDPLDRFNEVRGFSVEKQCNFYYGLRKFVPGRDFANCTFEPISSQAHNSSKENRRIYYIGSSHASQLTGLVERLQEITEYSQTMLVINAIMNPPYPKYLLGPPHDHESWPDEAILTQDDISQHIFTQANSGDIVVLGNHLLAFADASGSKLSDKDRRLALSIWLRNLTAFAKTANNHNLKVVVLMSVPYFKPVEGATREACSPAWFRPSMPKGCYSSRNRDEIRNLLLPIENGLKRVQSESKNLYLFDPFETLCPGRQCVSYSKEGRLYSDHWHLNNRGSRLLGDQFLAFLVAHKIN